MGLFVNFVLYPLEIITTSNPSVADNNGEGVVTAISAASLLRGQTATPMMNSAEENGNRSRSGSGMMKVTLRKKGPERII